MTFYCSFCKKAQEDVTYLISCPIEHTVRVFICDECVDACVLIVSDNDAKKDPTPFYDELAKALFP